MKKYVALSLALLLYSFVGVLSKLASSEPFLSMRFCWLYGGVIVLLGVYALAWQQIIKHISLTTAFANKAVTVVWGLIWGIFIFHESITWGKLLGVALVVAGVILFSVADREAEKL